MIIIIKIKNKNTLVISLFKCIILNINQLLYS